MGLSEFFGIVNRSDGLGGSPTVLNEISLSYKLKTTFYLEGDESWVKMHS